jgi:hypothetical protein
MALSRLIFRRRKIKGKEIGLMSVVYCFDNKKNGDAKQSTQE